MDARSHIDTGSVYAEVRQQFIACVSGLKPVDLNHAVPATPEWTVRDVLAHVVGLVADLNAQRFPPPEDDGRIEWTHNQVRTRRSRDVASIVAEWNAESAAFEAGLRIFGYEFGSHFVADLVTHYLDVLGALARPIDIDAVAVSVALDHYLAFVDTALTAWNWGTVEVSLGTRVIHLGGAGHHRARVDGSELDLLRSFSARRSLRRIRTLYWEGDVDDFLTLLQGNLPATYAFPPADFE